MAHAQRTFRNVAACIAILAAAGCGPDSESSVLEIAARGSVSGVVFLDRDGDGVFGATDVPGAKVGVQLRARGSSRSLATTMSGNDGAFVFTGVPVGSYQVAVDTVQLADSLRLAADPPEVTVILEDTARAIVSLGPRLISIPEARTRPGGRRVVVEGIAASASAAFSDSSLYVTDRRSGIRVIALPGSGVEPGDSVRVFGTVGSRDSQPILAGANVFGLGRATPAAPVRVSAAVAASADDGRLDAFPVQVVDATVLSVNVVSATQVNLTVTDSSGVLEVTLPGLAGISTATPLVPGVLLEVSGVLSPTGAGRWSLRARGADVTARIRRVTVAEARRTAAGQFVAIEGIALNGWATFGDASVHLADPTGAIRVLQVPPVFLFAGDSVRIVGTVGTGNSQPALFALATVTPSVRGRSAVPPPLSISTAVAATANQEVLDGALVRVRAAVVSANAVLPSGRLLTVNDGSGPLQVQIDFSTGVAGGAYLPGMSLDITGLLAASADGGSWTLKPRGRDDVSVR